MDSYYELVYPDDTRQRLDGVTSLESAKATAKAVAKMTAVKIKLQKVQPIDPDAAPKVRGS